MKFYDFYFEIAWLCCRIVGLGDGEIDKSIGRMEVILVRLTELKLQIGVQPASPVRL